MPKITREEVLTIASMSKMHINDEEIEVIIRNLEDVLTYAERVQTVAAIEQQEPSIKNINVMREDVVIPTNPQPILEQAPIASDSYFVVPKILDAE